MNYDEMLRGLAAAGHDVSGYKRPPMTTKAASEAPLPKRKPDAILVTLDLDDIASVIDAVVARVEVLEQQVAALQSEKASKQVVRVPSLRRVV